MTWMFDKTHPLASSVGVIFRQEHAHQFLNAADIFTCFNLKSEENERLLSVSGGRLLTLF